MTLQPEVDELYPSSYLLVPLRRNHETGLRVLLLGNIRCVYCWMFLIMSFFIIHFVYANRFAVCSNRMREGRLSSSVNMAAYAMVFVITWWMYC